MTKRLFAKSLCLAATILLAIEFSATLASAQTVSVVQTTADQTQLLQSQPSFQFDGSSGGVYTITVTDTLRQQYDGVGAALTDSGAWLLHNALTPDQRTSVLNNLFSPGGAGFNVLKTGMSGSGYDADSSGNPSPASFTYDDLSPGQTDFSMASFSVAHDDPYIVPTIQQILGINQDVKIFALPFSPPAWMKTNTGNCSTYPLDCGNFNTQSSYEQALASYFVDYVKEYQTRNIPIYALNIQNEPDYTTYNYPSEILAANDEANIIGYIGPALNAAHLGGVKLTGWEHDWDNLNYPETLLGNSQISQYLAGTSFHCYGGDPSAQVTLQQAYPQKDIWDTECADARATAGVTWATWFAWEAGHNLLWEIQSWGRSHIWWTLVQDQNFGPQYGNCSNQDCTPVVTIDTSTSPPTVTYNFEYYILAQVGRFVRPGAYVVSSSSTGIADAAFRNPDGSYVLVAYNGDTVSRLITVNWHNTSFNYTISPSSIATFTWAPTTASSITVVNDNTTGSGQNQFNYVGSWSYASGQPGPYDSDNHWSASTGNYYTLTFSGTQALVYGSKDFNDGYAGFSVDGGAETGVDLYSPHRVDDIFLWATPLLSPGTHQLKARVTGSNNPSSAGDVLPADRVDVLTATPASINDNTTGSGQNQFNYVGNWSYASGQPGPYDSDNHWSGTEGDYYTVQFTGIRAIVYGSKDVPDGYAGFSVDDGAEDHVNLYSSSRVDNVPLWATPLLPNGTHTLKVRVTGRVDPAATADIVPADRVDVVGSGPMPGQLYNLLVQTSGLCLDNPNGSTTHGTLMQQWDCYSNNPHQGWTLVSVANDEYNVVNQSSGMCLDDKDGSTVNNTPIQEWDCTSGDTNQNWSLVNAGNNAYNLVNQTSGMCLDNTGSKTDGGPIEQYTCNGSNSNQNWSFIEQ